MTVEIVGGIYANSLAILTDAAHLLSDISAFGISIMALRLGMKKAPKSFTFGY